MVFVERDGANALVGGRYLVAEVLGEGGVAIVRRARDTVSGRDVALKALRPARRADRERAVELFRQEFHMLSQLAHPHVVSVYDYGVDAGEPYYTMELLDGGDLLDRVPYPWRTACALARDVCSALSLIHSRRMVFRDLSPKNVRCTADGRAKLLDFGALSPMGLAQSFVGTPAISAPEAVHLQPLDARADLYSLGATLYYALTGRRPYPVSTVAQLFELWRKPPPPPSALAAEVPPALDGLVMELLQIDRALRPASAAETLDRLSAIAELERDESTKLVSKAYLTTPTLVGREASMARFQESMTAAVEGLGSALLVRGRRGVGRTRFLDACALDARIRGAVVLRADANDALTGDYGVARALAAQLVEALPESAQAAAGSKLETLSALVPSLGDLGQSPPAVPPVPSGSNETQSVFREWFLSVSQERPVFIAVDDVDRIDLPSAALVVLLAREAKGRRLLVMGSAPAGDAGVWTGALKLLAMESRPIKLAPLGAATVEQLLRSLFGDVPNVQLAAHRLHEISRGLPRDLMQLSQHLVDAGLARYSSGTWTLPHYLDEGALPSDMAHARRARIDALGDEARRLAQTFALGPEGLYTFGECVALTEHGDAVRLMPALDELVQAEIVALLAKDYCLSGLGWREPLVQSVTPAGARSLYLKLSEVCGRRPGQGFRAAQYLLDAGEEERGLDQLLRFSEASIRETTDSMEAFARLVRSLPEDWIVLYDRGLELCRKYGRPSKDALVLHTRVTGIASQLPVDAAKYFAPLFAELSYDAGLDIYETLDATHPQPDRLKKSMSLAAARRAATPGKETSYTPEVAIQWIGRRVSSATGSLAASISVDMLQVLPSLSPLVTVSPAFAFWQQMVDGVAARVLGQSERARELYERQLEHLAQPDRGGLEETYCVASVLALSLMLGMLEVSMGLERGLERAKRVESSPLHEINAVRIRMLYALWQGDVAGADGHAQQAELLSIERGRRQAQAGAHLLRELLGHALMDDLTRVKRTLEAIEPLSRHARGWQSVLYWAHAEHQRIRGNQTAALEHVQAALSSMHAAGHPVWSEASGTHVKILVAQDLCEEAAAAGRAYLEEADRRKIGYEKNYIRMPLSIALGRLGRREEAEAHSDAVIESFRRLGTTGLNLALAYETRAQVALDVAAPADFRKFMELYAEHCPTADGGPIAARYERLARQGQLRRAPSGGLVEDRELLDPSDTMTRIAARLEAVDPSARARLTLDLLLEDSGASEGFLFGLEEGELVLLAQRGPNELPTSLAEAARTYFLDQSRSDDVTLPAELGESAVQSQWTVEGRNVYCPVVLSHEEQNRLAVTGLALLRTELGGRFRYPATTAVHLSRVTSAGGVGRSPR